MSWLAHDLLQISGSNDLVYLGSEFLPPLPKPTSEIDRLATPRPRFLQQSLEASRSFWRDRMNVDSPEGRCPLWVEHSLQEAPFVVVRRAKSFAEIIPVGVRGSLRNQRFAAFLAPVSIRRRITPEQLSATRGRLSKARTEEIPGLQVLAVIEEQLASFSLAYGPTGSIGFELASGLPTATSASDLDLLIRAPERLPIQLAQELVSIFSGRTCRVDAQLETPRGAVSLTEYASGQRPLLLKQDAGPILVDDAWA
jgi:phosphoribosyl-dephospho-CoA transferase